MQTPESGPNQHLLYKSEEKNTLSYNSIIKHDHLIDNEQSDSFFDKPQLGPTTITIPASSVQIPPHSFTKALKVLVLNTLPLIFVYLAFFSIRNLSLHYMRKKDNDHLTNAVGIGNTLLSVAGIFVYMSLNIGLTSRSSQAFGIKNYQLIGFYLHRALIINLMCFIPGACCLYWSDKLCMLMGFDAETAAYTQQLTSWCIIGIFFMMLYNTMSAYLNACDIFVQPAIALLISVAGFWIVSYFLFERLNMDIMAMAISFNLMQVCAAILLFLYITIYNPVPGSFFWFKRQSFQEIWTLFKYEFFVGSMVFLEWICYQIIFLFAGRLTVPEIGALTIANTSLSVWYAVPLSLADTVLAFMGNAMGEGDVRKAKNFLKAGLFCSTLFVGVVETFFLLFSTEIAEFYTLDNDTIKESIKIFNVYLLYYPIDFTQAILSSGLRAIGKEKLGSLMFIICFYFLAIPLAYFLCFSAGLRDVGLIYSPIISLCCLLLWLLVSYWKIDWEEQVKVIRSGIKKDGKALIRSPDISQVETSFKH